MVISKFSTSAEVDDWDPEYFNKDKANENLMELISLFESLDIDEEEFDEAYVEDEGY